MPVAVAKPPVTTLILGAGASTSYGFPTGRALMANICASLTNPASRGARALHELGHAQDYCGAFASQLAESDYASVDTFLEHHPGWLGIGKDAIAAHLIPCEHESQLYVPKAPSNAWLRLLFDKWIACSRQVQMNVITFNYDRVFEHYFAKTLATRRMWSYQRSLKEVLARIPILHVYGQLGSLQKSHSNYRPYESELSSDAIRRAVASLHVIHEVSREHKTFERAKELLAKSSDVFSIGFGFHEENTARLGLGAGRPEDLPGRFFMRATTKGFSKTSWSRVTRRMNPELRNLEHCPWDAGRFVSERLYLREPNETSPLDVIARRLGTRP